MKMTGGKKKRISISIFVNTEGHQHHEKRPKKYYIDDNTMAALSSMDYEVYAVQQS
jgi:hypothetical protein